MTPDPTAPRLVEVAGAEALWLLAGSALGRLVFTLRGVLAIRPARHVLEHGALVVRAPVPVSALTGPNGEPATTAYHSDEVDPDTGWGWAVTATGPAEPATDLHSRVHYRRILPDWTHGPHDTLIRLRPEATTGYRLGRLLASVPDPADRQR